MIKLIVSSGQPGVERSAWRAATQVEISTGGWMLGNFETDDGPRPEFARTYNARECATISSRILQMNAGMAQVTLWIGKTDTPEYKTIYASTKKKDRGLLVVEPGTNATPKRIADILSIMEVETLNVTGDREHLVPGCGARAEKFLIQMLRRI